MTPEERAEIIVRIIDREVVRKGPGFDPTATLAAAIREAVEAEREACAMIAADELDILMKEAERGNLTPFGDGCLSATKNLLAEIRRRGEG